jgi:Predicted hydrolases or acyltransferases (alpha/beta hydrolase superfamily)
MTLNFKAFGQGDPIIILHGLFGTLDNWQTIGKKLAEHYMVYLVDQRNHGRSPHHPDFNYALMAEDLRTFMESQWIYKAHLIGHSMGGKTVMQFAMDFPDMIDQLIVVDIAPKTYAGGHQAIFDALNQLDLGSLEHRKEADKALSKNIKDYGVRQFLLKNLTREKAGGYRWKMNLPVIQQHYQAILDTIPLNEAFEEKSLFIRGSQSNYIMDEDWPTVLSYFPNAHLATVEGSGHWVHAEAPAELLKLVSDFLN